MIEKSGHIKNPLTIIGIFAGIAEISSATVLPMLEKDIQFVFVWFVIAFPVLLVISFFATLNFNNKVLYAPSDFQSDDNFLKTVRLTSDESKEKREIEIKSLRTELTPIEKTSTKEIGQNFKIDFRQLPTNYQIVEDLALREYEKESNASIKREVRVITSGANGTFDGVIEMENRVELIEVKFFPLPLTEDGLYTRIKSVALRYSQITRQSKRESLLVFLIVCDYPIPSKDTIGDVVKKIGDNFNIPIKVKAFNFKDLKAKYGIEDSEKN
jgi:hypothetical protein